MNFWTRNLANGFVGRIFKNNVNGRSTYANINIYNLNYCKQSVLVWVKWNPHEDSEIKALVTIRSIYAFLFLDVMKCSQFQWIWSICITWLHVHTTLSLSPHFISFHSHFTYLSLLPSQTVKPIFSSPNIQQVQKYVLKKENYYRLSVKAPALHYYMPVEDTVWKQLLFSVYSLCSYSM